MDEKEKIILPLDRELIRLINIFGNTNKLNFQQSIESISKVYLTDEDNIYQVAMASDLEGRMNTLESRLLNLAKTTHCQIEIIERLERQLAELEYKDETNDYDSRIKENRLMASQVQKSLSQLYDKLDFLSE